MFLHLVPGCGIREQGDDLRLWNVTNRRHNIFKIFWLKIFRHIIRRKDFAMHLQLVADQLANLCVDSFVVKFDKLGNPIAPDRNIFSDGGDDEVSLSDSD